MNGFRTSARLTFLILLFLMVGGTSSRADIRYAVSEKTVFIRIQKDGSADVTERIVYAIKGSVNNLVLAFMKPEAGGVTFQRLISEGWRGEVECRPLAAGQWDPTVFTGTYSLYDEPASLKLRAYYVFGKYRSRFVAQYRIDGAVDRYLDCADFRFLPVGADWPTRVGNIHVQVILPDGAVSWKPEAFIHGVFVGQADVAQDRMVDFDIPDTVPGEAPVLRILFPQNLVPDRSWKLPLHRRDMLRKEEAVLRREAEAPSLKARVNAAREAGQRAFAAILASRARMAATVGSLLLTLLGFAAAFWVRFRVREPRPVPPSAPKLELLADNPWLARMLLHGGRFDARALLAALVRACETGGMKLAGAVGKHDPLRLRMASSESVVSPDDPESFRRTSMDAFQCRLAEWTALLLDGDGMVRFPRQGDPFLDPERIDALRQAWERLHVAASDTFGRCGFTTRIHARIRRIALAAGMLLVAAALVTGVSLSIPQPYLMALPGLLLVWLGMTGNAFNSRAVGFRKALRQVGRQFLRRRKAPECAVTVPTTVDNRLAMTRQPVALRLSLAIALGVERPCLDEAGLRVVRALAGIDQGHGITNADIRLVARSIRRTRRRLGGDILPAMRDVERTTDHA